jgi:hypothetical protein
MKLFDPSRRAIIIVCLVLFVGGFAAIAVTNHAPQPVATTATKLAWNHAGWGQVKHGMYMDEVRALVGRPDHVTHSEGYGGTTNVWSFRANGRIYIVSFEDDRVTSKGSI